jgi:hypothetical protein
VSVQMGYRQLKLFTQMLAADQQLEESNTPEG